MRACVVLLAIGCYGDDDAATPSPQADAVDVSESDVDADSDTDSDTDVVVDTGDTTPLLTADTGRIHSADTGTTATSDSGSSTSDSGCDYGYDDVFCGYVCGPGAACLGCLSIADSDSDSGHEVFIDFFCYPCGSAC